MPNPTNAGLDLLGTDALIRRRAAYRRLLGQLLRDPGTAVARENVRRYLGEIAAALAERESAVAA